MVQWRCCTVSGTPKAEANWPGPQVAPIRPGPVRFRLGRPRGGVCFFSARFLGFLWSGVLFGMVWTFWGSAFISEGRCEVTRSRQLRLFPSNCGCFWGVKCLRFKKLCIHLFGWFSGLVNKIPPRQLARITDSFWWKAAPKSLI